MLNETMWNIFKSTGNVNAYLYVKGCEALELQNEKCSKYDKKQSLLVKETTIV